MGLPPIWRFREMKRDEPGIDPVHGEFFTTEEFEDLNGALELMGTPLAKPLKREALPCVSVQNVPILVPIFVSIFVHFSLVFVVIIVSIFVNNPCN